MTAPLPRLVGLGGTLRANSRTRSTLRAALTIAQAQGAQTELLDLRELALPMYVPDWSIAEYPEPQQASLTRFIDTCRRADAMLWASPTYHGTLSGVLKNALDHIELMSDDPAPYLQGRAVGLITVSDPLTFGAMTNVVYELRAWLAPTWVTLSYADFDADFQLNSPRAERRLTRLVGELLEFAQFRMSR
jgi:FMN reductase